MGKDLEKLKHLTCRPMLSCMTEPGRSDDAKHLHFQIPQLGEEHITVLNVISPMATSIAGIPPMVVLFSFTRYALGTSGCLAEY